MKRSTVIPFMAAIALALLLSACRKEDHPHMPGHWRIHKLTYDFDSAVITYNWKGDPVRLTRGYAGTGSGNYEFRYDRQGRLRDYISIYSNGASYEFWHRYYYDQANRTVKDTAYWFGMVGENPTPDPNLPPPYDSLVVLTSSIYTFDTQNRIIESEDTYYSDNTPFVRYTVIYTYDQRGNLEKIFRSNNTNPADTSTTVLSNYDNKINMHRTHPVWQFIDRDFSRNNPFVATTYNAQGLPTRINTSGSHDFRGFIGIYYTQLDVEYECR